ncbi:NAD(P)/FAD-dependent oxidoreductase, partial [Sulfobacillus sp. DSM 109850]|nr:NAD(P)/FAD-dependent oxidoreductase [Sulfobacillus harzensis]NMP25118.1 NAD(P)/FAD-dependent oxidoreductase [Sulfobacillus harzensis]
MTRVVLLGGGVGGSMVSNQLARELKSEIVRGEVEITVINASEVHV